MLKIASALASKAATFSETLDSISTHFQRKIATSRLIGIPTTEYIPLTDVDSESPSETEKQQQIKKIEKRPFIALIRGYCALNLLRIGFKCDFCLYSAVTFAGDFRNNFCCFSASKSYYRNLNSSTEFPAPAMSSKELVRGLKLKRMQNQDSKFSVELSRSYCTFNGPGDERAFGGFSRR